MDRRRRVLSGAALLLLAAANAPAFPLREARWLAPESLPESLLNAPAECLALPSNPVERRAVLTGRALFGHPLLLGGQAARAGLSCASCHRNGHGNRDFVFPGLSGAPGTADVTHSLMSRARGDGVFNPKPIPDLARPRMSRDPRDPALERFIRGLIVEEFDGPAPSPATLASLATYVRALSPSTCARAPTVPVSLGAALSDLREMALLVEDADSEMKPLLIAAMRAKLGTIDERFSPPGLEVARAALRAADADLREGGVESWRLNWGPRQRLLKKQEPRSLYAPAILRAHFAISEPRKP